MLSMFIFVYDIEILYFFNRKYQQKIYTCAKAFLKLGLQRHHSVCIIGFNSPEWFISDLAAIHAGLVKLKLKILILL